MKNIKPGIYQHYSGKHYKVIGIGHHSESLEKFVLYRALYTDKTFGKNALWARPLELFTDTVTVDNKQIPHFKYIKETNKNDTPIPNHMKICLSPYAEGSGVGTYILELADYLSENTNHEIIVIGNSKPSKPNLKVHKSPKKFKFFFEIPPVSWIYGPYTDYKLSKLVNKINPDIFITSDHMAPNNIKAPTIQVGWDYHKGLTGCIKLALKYERWYLLPYRIIRELEMSIKEYFATRKAKLILGVTNHLTQILKDKKLNAVFIPPGINVQPHNEKKSGTTTITFIGRNHIWTKRKGLKHLLDALTLIEKHRPVQYNLNLIGNVPKNFNRILNQYKTIRHHIKIRGLLPREETLKIIKCSHLLAAPSLYDEFGFAVLEALSYGTPVIASKHNHSFKEMIGNNEAGLSVDIHNKREFAQQLHTLLTNKQKLNQLSKQAIEHVKKNYSWNVIAPKIMKESTLLIRPPTNL